MINQDFKDLFRIFNECGVRYLVVGAYAVVYYTEPRYTKDLDIWVETTPENAKRVWEALQQFGAPLIDVTEKDFCNREIVYQIGVEPNRIDIMTDITGIRFSDAWKNRVKSKYEGESIYVLGIDDLIRAKKKAGRLQDELDLQLLEKIKKNTKKKGDFH
ncbi:MAG: hypothetical protein ABIL68_06300 [bacterium]